MPKEARRRIFYFLIAIFLILGTGVVFYAQGWRAAFQPFSIGKVGAIYVRTFPANASVVLNGKMKDRKIGLFDKGTFLNHILPGEYDLEVNSPGFQSWKLPVQVRSALVTNLPNVVLVPSAPTTATSTPVRNIIVAGNTLLIETASGTQTFSGMPISGSEILAGSEGGSVILSYAAATRDYFTADIPRSTSTNLGRLAGQPAGRAVIAFQPVPKDETLFLASGPAGLNLLRVPSGEILRLATTSVAASAAAPGRVVWAMFDAETNASLLSAYEIPSRNLNSNFELVPGHVTSLLFLESGEMFALTKDGSLYSLNFSQSSRVRLAQNARDMNLSGNSEKLAVLGNRGVLVLFLRNNKPNLEIELPNAAQIQKLTWYRDGEHLFAHYPDKVMFLDLIDADLLNFATVATITRAEYEPGSNILYFLKDGALHKLDFPGS